MINNPTINYYLNKYKAKGKMIPIYLRISLARKKAECATKYLLEPKDWNISGQCTRKNAEINEDLIATKNKVYDIVKTLEKENKPVSATIIKDILTGKYKFTKGIIESFDRYIYRLALEGDVKKTTIFLFGVTKRHVQNFLKARNIEEYPLEGIDYNLISDFDLYLISQKVNYGANTMQRNTANKHHSRVKTILLRAIKEGYISKNPYTDFKLKKKPSNRTFLTFEELNKISEHSLGGNESLKKVRDIFMFTVYTALRFEDAQKLTMDCITKEKNGKQVLRINQEKTNENIAIPLLKQALEIIHKYEDSPERKVLNKVLPKFTNQKVNAYLKVIADLAGIKKSLTHHVARHTCATTILLSNEVPIEAVSKWLGHTNIKTTQIYAKITNDYLQKVADKLELGFNLTLNLNER